MKRSLVETRRQTRINELPDAGLWIFDRVALRAKSINVQHDYVARPILKICLDPPPIVRRTVKFRCATDDACAGLLLKML